MTKRKEVYALKLVGGRMDWHHVGHALEGRDGSLTIQLDVLPTTTLLEIREVGQLAEVG